jgi:hypothetical protein
MRTMEGASLCGGGGSVHDGAVPTVKVSVRAPPLTSAQSQRDCASKPRVGAAPTLGSK